MNLSELSNADLSFQFIWFQTKADKTEWCDQYCLAMDGGTHHACADRYFRSIVGKASRPSYYCVCEEISCTHNQRKGNNGRFFYHNAGSILCKECENGRHSAG